MQQFKAISGFILMAIILGGFVSITNLNPSPTNTRVLPSPTPRSTTSPTSFTLQEIARHNSPSDCWMVVNDTVYDVTAFIASNEHNPEILRGCGLDATVMFNEERKHARGRSQTLLTELAIGILDT